MLDKTVEWKRSMAAILKRGCSEEYAVLLLRVLNVTENEEQNARDNASDQSTP